MSVHVCTQTAPAKSATTTPAVRMPCCPSKAKNNLEPPKKSPVSSPSVLCIRNDILFSPHLSSPFYLSNFTTFYLYPECLICCIGRQFLDRQLSKQGENDQPTFCFEFLSFCLGSRHLEGPSVIRLKIPLSPGPVRPHVLHPCLGSIAPSLPHILPPHMSLGTCCGSVLVIAGPCTHTHSHLGGVLVIALG